VWIDPARPFEPKWDGFRAIVRTGEDFAVRSRRGWPITDLLPEFASLPIRGVFDGELVAFGNDRKPSFRQVCRRMLERNASVPVTLILFDVLRLDGEATIGLPHWHRPICSKPSTSQARASSVRGWTTLARSDTRFSSIS
jgi:ATP-dependent DNA ligase